MIKNYFFLNRLAFELNSVLKRKKIISVFTQEKDKLIIEFENEEQNIYLEICVNHSFPYLILREVFIRKKRNALDLFPELLGKSIVEIITADNDRVIAFLLDDNSIAFFTVRGKLTNFYYKLNEEFIPFKKIDSDELFQVEMDISKKNFIRGLNIPAFTDIDDCSSIEEIRKKFPFIGREVAVLAKSFDEKSLIKNILRAIRILQENKPVIYIDNINFEIEFSFEHINLAIKFTEIKSFENLNIALDFFLHQKELVAQKKEKKEVILKHIDKELKRIANKQNNLLKLIREGNKEEYYKKLGNLLLINLKKITPGFNSVTVEDTFGEGNEIEIKLDSKLSPQENVQKYFDRAKESKISFIKAKELMVSTESEKQKLLRYKENLLSASTIKEIEQIAKGLKIKMKSEKPESESLTGKFKQYIVDGKYKVYVGKDSRSNDLLTLKFAKQNDFWFHARSVPGSHVILRVENSKEAIPKSVLKKVASIAAYHSKAKTAGIVPVSYTLKKFVVKRKGMEPGKVSLLKEDTLLVQPEISSGVEFVED